MKEKDQPLVSVVFPVGPRGREYLNDAVSSIVSQTYSSVELLLVDDSQTGDLHKLLPDAGRAASVRIMRNRNEAGISGALNTGFAAAAGKYIARMDVDDIALPHRLARQVEFLEAHPEAGVVGSRVRRFGALSTEIPVPLSHEEIHVRLLFENCMVHPSVMIRASILPPESPYDEHQYRHAEDYDLWCRVAKTSRLANLPDVLLRYRVHPEQVGQTAPAEQQRSTNLIRARSLREWGLEAGAETFDLHNQIGSRAYEPSVDFAKRAEAWLLHLCAHNRANPRYEDAVLRQVATAIWFDICRYCSRWVSGLYGVWAASPLQSFPGISDWFIFRAKSFLVPGAR